MGAVIVKTDKRLDISHAPKLEKDLMDLIDAGETEILLDMADTTYISSVALRALLKAKKALKAVGGNLVLRNVTDSVMEVFDVTNFTSVLTFEEE